jgi:large subunit ribosomal protein L18
MAQGPTYKVKFRRRREGKTNYYRRRRLLLSRTPRLVIRKTNTATIVQVIEAQVIGDLTLATAKSTELVSHGWNAGTGNTPAAYLTGLLAGRRAKQSGVSESILDIGLNPPVRGSRVYAALKGVLDSGLEVPHDPEVIPDDERLSGKHIVAGFKHFQESKSSPNQFSSTQEVQESASRCCEETKEESTGGETRSQTT